MPDPAPGFQQQQQAFTAFIRDPEHAPPPAQMPPRRLALYAELFFNTTNEQLRTNFPVLHRITDPDHWRAIVRDFMRCHRCQTPLFIEIGLEFLDYLQHEREAAASDWPFMLQLAHYEYVELAVAISTADEDLLPYDPNGDLLQEAPVIAPTAWPLSYVWPVHRIGPDYLPEDAPTQATHLVVYRDRRDKVRFLEINDASQRLLQLLRDGPSRPGAALLEQIAREMDHPDPAAVMQGGRELLLDLRERNVIIGTRPEVC